MRRVIVKCPGLMKPARVFDLLKDDNGDRFIEIRFPKADKLRIPLDQYLEELETADPET